MKPLDSDKKVSKEVSAPAEATQAAPVEEEKIDFSKVQIEPLFEDQVDFDTFSKSDFRAVKVKECEAVKKSKKLLKFVLDDGTGVDRVILMTVKGAFYSEKADAGNAILEACKAMTNPDPISLGEYRGFTMELYFEAREYKVRLKGELGYPVTLGTDTFGNITRLDNALEGLPKRLEMNEMELDNLKKQFETAKVDVERPFPQEEELKAKTDRLNELNALLNVDKRENEIVGGEPDEGEEPPEKKPRDLER